MKPERRYSCCLLDPGCLAIALFLIVFWGAVIWLIVRALS